MSYSEIILLAIALSIDACVVSFSYGLCLQKKKRLNSLLLAVTTGFFQGLMPIIGYFFAHSIKTYICPYSKLIVFLIFGYLGINFISDSFKNKNYKNICIGLGTLLLVGIATSIDAFSAGISLLLTSSPLKFSVITIGIITFINSLIGYWLGYGMKTLNSKWLEITGGLILIGLAISNLF